LGQSGFVEVAAAGAAVCRVAAGEEGVAAAGTGVAGLPACIALAVSLACIGSFVRVVVAGWLACAGHTAGTNAKRNSTAAGKWCFKDMPTL
jgi:hypothetical protein